MRVQIDLVKNVAMVKKDRQTATKITGRKTSYATRTAQAQNVIRHSLVWGNREQLRQLRRYMTYGNVARMSPTCLTRHARLLTSSTRRIQSCVGQERSRSLNLESLTSLNSAKSVVQYQF